MTEPEPTVSNNGVMELNFDDITPIEIKVSVNGKPYILREATGDAAARWRNRQLTSFRLGPNGNPVGFGNAPGGGGLGDTDALLVSLCLFEVLPNGKFRAVDERQIRSWQGRIVQKLADKAKEISELSEGDETLEDLMKQRIKLDKRIAKLRAKNSKNVPEGTPAGTD